MYYEINVAKDGYHFFATAERSIYSLKQLKKMYKLFLEKFPEEEGYSITVSHHPGTSYLMDLDSLTD